ncbi:MAG: hypothetical protein HUJ64_01450, partial [Limosilactobacillus mucosae]|nr:hypothetical protein [Limosilactobacillus mucosae]
EDSDLTKAAANVASAVTLTFKKLQNAYVKIIDEDDSNSVLYDETAADANSANQAQKQGTSISFTQPQTKLDALLKAGYVLDSAKTQPLNQTTFKAAVFDSDDTGDQIFTVYLKHGTATIGVDTTKQTSQAEAGTVINADSDNQVTWPDAVKYDNLTRQATQTVNYRYQGEAQAHESNVQNAVLTRTVTIDKVTGKVIGYSTFTTHKFSSVASPTIDNYEYVKSADKVVAGETATAVVGQDGQETDQLTFEYTVYYKTNGTWKKINEPVYDESGKVSYQSDATGAHYITKSDDAITVTATVPTYQGYTAVFETNGDKTTDQTLNKNSQTSAQSQIISLQNDQAGQDSTVTYTPDAQKLTYRIYDQTLGKYINVDAADQLTDKTYGTLADGFSDGDASYTSSTKQQTTKEKLQALQNSLVKLGYLIIKTDNLPTTFDHDDDVNQNVTITVAHDYAIFKDSQTAQDAKTNGTVTDQTGQSAVYLWGESDNGKQLVTDAAYTDNTTATRTINFVFNGTAKSKPSPASIVQTVAYQRSIVWTMDLVTGAMTRDHADWQFVSAKTGATQTTMTEDGTIAPTGESDSLGKEVMPAVTGSFAGWYQTSGTVAELASDAQLLSPDAQKEGVAANQTATVNLTYLRYQKATIQIIDDNADAQQTLTNDQLTAGDGTLYTQIELEGQ